MRTFRSSLEVFKYVPDEPSALAPSKKVQSEAQMHVKQEQEARPLTPPVSGPGIRRSSRKRRGVGTKGDCVGGRNLSATSDLSSSDDKPSASIASKVIKKKKRKATRPYADPSLYAHLPQSIPDHLSHNLTLLICGLNPGVMTARTGHHFSNPTNLFWPLLYSSGIITHPFRAPDSHRLVTDFNIGITNIVSRPTAEGGELSRQECRDGARRIIDVVARTRPRAVMFTGKGIWESVFYVLHGRPLRKSDAFTFGWQCEILPFAKDNDFIVDSGHKDLDGHNIKLEQSPGIGTIDTAITTNFTSISVSPAPSLHSGAHARESERGETTSTGCRIFVTMGTSGRVAGYTPAYKREVFNQLGEWMTQQRADAEMKNEALASAPAPVPTDNARPFSVDIFKSE